MPRSPEAGLLNESEIAIRAIEHEDTTSILSAILQASDYGVLLTDLEHRSLAANRRFGEIFQLDIQEVVLSDVFEVRAKVKPLIPDLSEWERNLDAVYADPRREQTDELELLTDPPTWIRRNTAPVFGADGSVIGRLWTFLDITFDRRRERMRESLQKLSLVYHRDPDVVYRAIVEEMCRFFDGSIALLSIRQNEFLEFRAAAGVPPEMSHIAGNSVRESYCQFAMERMSSFVVQDAREHAQYENLLPAKLGLTRYLGVPIFGHDGAVLGTLCVLDSKSDVPVKDEDIQYVTLLGMRIGAEVAREQATEQRLSEKQAVVEFQQSRLAQTQAVLESMNAAFELMGRHVEIRDLICDQVRLLANLLDARSATVALRNELNEFVGYQALSGGEVEAVTLSTAARHTLPTTRPSLLYGDDAKRAVPGTDYEVVSFIDLPENQAALLAFERNAVQAEDFHTRTHLEAVAEQVALLLKSHFLYKALERVNTELRETQASLIQSEKLTIAGTLAASTAHDIKNILASLSIELSMSSADPFKALDSVRENLDRFQVLSHRLLSYAKPRMVALDDVDIGDVLRRVLSLTAAQLRMSGVQVSLLVPADLPRLHGDSHQLEHLFVNLVLNAVQAMEANGGRLSISARQFGDLLEIAVKDTGIGVPKDLSDQLFAPFRSTRREGFGLGLYSCKRIVDEHGGTLEVESSNNGTTFLIRLPARNA